MNDLAQWLLDLPQYFARFADWLNTPIGVGDWSFTPLMAFGASAGAFVAILIILKIKNLII